MNKNDNKNRTMKQPPGRPRVTGNRLRLEERPATTGVDDILDLLGASELVVQREDGGYDPYDKRRARRKTPGEPKKNPR